MTRKFFLLFNFSIFFGSKIVLFFLAEDFFSNSKKKFLVRKKKNVLRQYIKKKNFFTPEIISVGIRYAAIFKRPSPSLFMLSPTLQKPTPILGSPIHVSDMKVKKGKSVFFFEDTPINNHIN